MAVSRSIHAIPATELSAAMTGSYVEIGTLLYRPVILIFDNQSTVAVAISLDGGLNVWKTFSAGSSLVLDMRANNGIASDFTFPLGTKIHGNGASGNFYVSYIYAKES